MSASVRVSHFPKCGHAHRALVFAKLAGIAQEALFVDLAAGARKTPEVLAMKPNGQAPVLEDGDTIVADVAAYSYKAHAPEGNVSLDPCPNVRASLARFEAPDGFEAAPATAAGLVA